MAFRVGYPSRGSGLIGLRTRFIVSVFSEKSHESGGDVVEISRPDRSSLSCRSNHGDTSVSDEAGFHRLLHFGRKVVGSLADSNLFVVDGELVPLDG